MNRKIIEKLSMFTEEAREILDGRNRRVSLE